VAKYLLGHASAGHVQHYDHVKLRKAEKLEGEQGAFPIREEEMRRVEEVVGGGRDITPKGWIPPDLRTLQQKLFAQIRVDCLVLIAKLNPFLKGELMIFSFDR
jgi:hypothetical protein